MAILSKPLFFGSRHVAGVSQTYRRINHLSNCHFWVEKAGRVIEPTQIEPFEGGRRIYLPFTEAEQELIGRQWYSAQAEMWGVDKREVRERIWHWELAFDKGANGKCWFNAMNYQMRHGGTLVCGLMGHYSKSLGYVDVDYGY